jgi:hypothetical protein
MNLKNKLSLIKKNGGSIIYLTCLAILFIDSTKMGTIISLYINVHNDDNLLPTYQVN